MLHKPCHARDPVCLSMTLAPQSSHAVLSSTTKGEWDLRQTSTCQSTAYVADAAPSPVTSSKAPPD